MKCENRFCIYQYKGNCTLDEINIDSSGMCTECIRPDIDEDFLTKEKIKLLNIYKNTK